LAPDSGAIGLGCDRDSLSQCWRHDPAAFAENDSPESLAFAIPVKERFIAIEQKSPNLTCGQIDRLGAAPGQIDQTTQAVFSCAGDRAARDQVALSQVAT